MFLCQGLQILLKLLTNVESHEQAAQSFYQTYFTDILQHVFSVVTDTSHTAALSMHASILAYMFTLVESNRIKVQLGPVPNNILYIQVSYNTLLFSSKPNSIEKYQRSGYVKTVYWSFILTFNKFDNK